MAIAFYSLYLIFLVFSSASSVFSNPSAMENLFPQRRQFENGDFLVRRRRADDVSKTSLETDPICKDVNAYYDQDEEQAIRKNASEFIFDNRQNNFAVLYVGRESPILLVLESFKDSGLWRSSNSGESFEKIGSSAFEEQADLKQHEYLHLRPNIFQHPQFKDYVIIFARKYASGGLQTLLFLSEDTAQSFVCHTLNFGLPAFGEEINFVWHRDDVNKILLRSKYGELFYSDNKGQAWTRVQSVDFDFRFRYPKDAGIKAQSIAPFFSFRYPKDETYESQSWIFYLEYTSSPLPYDDLNPRFNLTKYDLNKQEKEVIAEKVRDFAIQGDTLYASIENSSDSTYSLHISRDSGLRWFRANIKHMAYGGFLSVLNTESEIMFVHVDPNEDISYWEERRGTLYISDSDMLVFTISLTNHACVRRRFSWQSLIDFYPVKGMKGTFITTVLKGDSNLITMVSFNRGVSWTVPEVANVSDCNNCRFLIYNTIARYLKGPRIIGDTPLSKVKAPGLILVNAFYKNSTVISDLTLPDLFLSKNGGYSWTKIREGPHIYEILDQGGMLVAARTQNNKSKPFLTNSISISFDEGTCWIDVPFTEKEVFINDILVEPTESSTKVNIWDKMGVGLWGTSNWTMYTFDLSSILNVCDQDKDYKEWVSHSENGQDGCLLGSKETYRRRKPESFCRNGEAFQGDAIIKEEICTCTQADWECNFGYVQPMGSQKCLPSSDKNFLDAICLESSIIEKVEFSAYRKVSGDKCEGGVFYEPEENTFTTQELCRGIPSSDYTFLLVSIGLLFFLISVGAVCYFGRREPTSVTLSHKVITDDPKSDFNSSSPNPGTGFSNIGCTDFTSQQESKNTNGSTEINLHVGSVNSSHIET